MTTFDDDFMRVHLDGQTANHFVKQLGFEWPPPERIAIDLVEMDNEVYGTFRFAKDDDPTGKILVRERMSAITDAERKTMTHVCRGSEYFPASWTRKQIERHL